MDFAWTRSVLEDYHNVDRRNNLVYLGDEETNIWWVIDNGKGEAYIWDELDENNPAEEFREQVDQFGIDPSNYDEENLVSQEYLANYVKSGGEQAKL